MSRKTIIVLTLFLAACCAMALEASFQKRLVLVPSGTPPSDWSSLPEAEPRLTVPSFPGDLRLSSAITQLLSQLNTSSEFEPSNFE